MIYTVPLYNTSLVSTSLSPTFFSHHYAVPRVTVETVVHAPPPPPPPPKVVKTVTETVTTTVTETKVPLATSTCLWSHGPTNFYEIHSYHPSEKY
jgi:hypothetical protein